MNKIKFLPYNAGSQSLGRLKQRINELADNTALIVRHDSPTYRPRDNHLIVNWGSSSLPSTWTLNGTVLNLPQKVAVSGNKLSTFNKLQNAGLGNILPDYTTDRNVANQWLTDGHTVLERHSLTGHSGDGIRIVRSGEDLSNAPLYVKYKKKRNEYRVHVFNGRVLFVQEKRRQRERERTDDESLIRSHQNGWVFCREDIDISLVDMEKLRLFACLAVNTLGLDFGAVDIIYNAREDSFYVLEVNTAPSLEGQSLDDYANAFLGLLE